MGFLSLRYQRMMGLIHRGHWIYSSWVFKFRSFAISLWEGTFTILLAFHKPRYVEPTPELAVLPGAVPHTFDPSSLEAEAGRSL